MVSCEVEPGCWERQLAAGKLLFQGTKRLRGPVSQVGEEGKKEVKSPRVPGNEQGQANVEFVAWMPG